MVGGPSSQTSLTRCSTSKSMLQSDHSSMTRRHAPKSTAPVSPSMKPTQLRKALHKILSKGKIQRPQSSKDSQSDRHSLRDTADVRSQKRRARQNTMPVVIDKFKGVMCLVPDHLEDQLTFSQGDEPEAVRSRVRKLTTQRERVVHGRETTEGSETEGNVLSSSKMGNETSITSVTVEEATTDLMSGNVRVIRHKYVTQTEKSSARAVESGSFVKMSRENPLISSCVADTTVSTSDGETKERARTNFKNEDSSDPRQGASQPSVQCCQGFHDLPVLGQAEPEVTQSSRVVMTGTGTKRRREKRKEIDLCKERKQHDVRSLSEQNLEERKRKTSYSKTKRRTGPQLTDGESSMYVRGGEDAVSEKNNKSSTQSERDDKKKLPCAKASASENGSSVTGVGEVARSKSSQELCSKNFSTPSHFEHDSSNYQHNITSTPLIKSRGKLEHPNVSGFPSGSESAERPGVGILTKETSKPLDTTPRSEDYPKWGSETMSDGARKKALYGAPEAKPPPGKPSPRKTLHEKELPDKMLADFKPPDSKLRTNLLADTTLFSKCPRAKLRPTGSSTDFKLTSVYPTNFMSVFGKKNVFEDYISSEQRQLSRVISGLKFDVTSLMPSLERCPPPVDAPKDVSTPVNGLNPDITTKFHHQSTDENPTAGTIVNLKREPAKERRKKAVMTVDSKVVQFDLLGDGGRRVSEADQILNDAESIITTTVEDTKCYPEQGYKGPREYEALQLRRQRATGAIRNKIGVRKYQPYTNPRLAKNETTVFGQHRWFSSTALTQSSSSMKETKSSNETKDEIIEETGGDAMNEAPIRRSTWKGDNVTLETAKRSTKQHPRFILSRPRIDHNSKDPCETNGQESSTDEKELKNFKRCKADPIKDNKTRKKFHKTYSTDSSSDRDHPAPWRINMEGGVKCKHSMFSTAKIRMIEALPEENLGSLGAEKSSRGARAEEGQLKGEEKKAFDSPDNDRGRPLYNNDQKRDHGMGSNSTLSVSKQTTASKRQSDDATSCASKKPRKEVEKKKKMESKQVGFKSKVTRHVVSETLTSPRIAKGDGFKPRVAKTEGDLLELRRERENKLNREGISHTRLTGEKANTMAGVTIRKRIKKILSSNKDNVEQPAPEVNGRSKISRIPIYVGASLTKSLSAVNNRRGACSMAQNATRSLTNHAGQHQAMVSKDLIARQSHLKVSGNEPVQRVATTAAKNSGHEFTRKCSAHRLDKKRNCEEARSAKPVESDLKMCQHFEENKSTFGQLTLTGADQELKAVLPMLIDHSKDSIIIITPDTKIKQLTSIIDKVGQLQPVGTGSGVQVKKRGHEDDVGQADDRKPLRDTCTAHGARHQRLSVTDEKGRALKSSMARDDAYDNEGVMLGSSISGSGLGDEDLHSHIANKRLRHICSPEACRLCGTHTQDNTTCEMGKVDQMTSHQQYTMNTQKLLFRRTLTRQDNLKVPYDYEDAALDQKDGQINEYFIMHDAYRVFKRRKSPVVAKDDLTVGYVNDKNLQSDDDRVSGMSSPLSSALKVRKERCHHQTKLSINNEDLAPDKTKKRKKKSNTSIKSSESRTVRSLGILSPVQVETEPLLPDDAKDDDDESDVIQVVTYEDYHCRSESTTAPPGESPRIMSSPVPGYQRNTRSYSMKIAKESPQKVGSRPAHSDYIIDPEVQHYRISRITKRKNPNPANEAPAKHEFGTNVPTKQFPQDRQSKYRNAMSVKKPTHVPAKQTRGTIGGKANVGTRFDEDEKKGWRAQGKLSHCHHEMYTESRDRHRKEAQAIPDDRKYGEILHKAGETSRAWAKMKSGDGPKVRETRLKQVSGAGHHQGDIVVDKNRHGTRHNIDRATRRTADVTMDAAGRKVHEPSAAPRGRRAPKESQDGATDGTIDKNDPETLRVNPFYLKRNFAKLKNPFATITRQKANLRVLDELENKQHVHYEPKPYSEEPKPRQRVDFTRRDAANSFLKGSVDKQTDNLLNGSATGTANMDRITCIPSTVRVKQTKTSLQRQRSSHLHHDISQYMNFAWQADEKVTNQRKGQNNLTSSRVEDDGRSFDDGNVFVSSPYPADQKFDQKDTTHTLPRETSPRTRRKNTDSSGDHVAEQATSNVMFVSNKSPRKTNSQIREPKQKSPSYEKHERDFTRAGRVHYRNGRRVLPKEENDTEAVIDTHSSNIEFFRDNGPTKDFDYSTTMPSTEAEMWFHNDAKAKKKASEKSKKIFRQQATAQNKVSRKASNHALGSTTRKCESNSKTLHSITSEPKSWGLNKQRIAQNVRAVLSSADFEKVWKRIETTKSETGVISSEDQRWIVNQLLLGGKESVPKSNSEPQGRDVTKVNDTSYKIIHDKVHKPSRGVKVETNDEVTVRKNAENTAKEAAKEKKQKKFTRPPPENTDYFSDLRKNGNSSPHSNPTALVLTGQKLYGNSMSDRKDDELSKDFFSDFGAKPSYQHRDAFKKLLQAKETEAATRSENTLDDVSHDQTNTFPGRHKRKRSLADGHNEAACGRSESQKYLKPATEPARSTALSTFMDDISTWVGHSRKSKPQITMSSHFSQPVLSVTASTSNVQSAGRNTEDAAETIDVDIKPELTEDMTGENVEEEDAVNSAPKPDKPFRSPKSMTAVGNAANLFTQAWKKKSSSVLEINLGTIEEEVAFPKSSSPTQTNEKVSATRLFDTAISKEVASNSAGETLSHSKMNEIERRREKMNEAAISLLEECLLLSASGARSPTDANVHQSTKGPAKGQAASPVCRPRDGGNRKSKEANPSCDSRNSMWRFEDSPSTADIVISWLAQTNDTELSIGRLTDQDLSNEHAESSSKHQVKSEDDLCLGRANEENLKQKSTTGITLQNGASKSKTEEVKTDPLAERIKPRKRVRAVEKEALKAINDMGPAWWLKQVETQGSHFPTVQKNVRPIKAQGKEETAKGPGQKTTKSIMRGRGVSRDRSAWPQVTESKISAWKRAARKRVEPIADQHPSSQGTNADSAPGNDVDTGEGNPPTRFEQVSSQHKITPNKSLSKFGNKDQRFKDDAIDRSDKRIRYRGSHPMLPTHSTRHGSSKQSSSLQFFSKSDSSAGNNRGPSGKDQSDHRHAARNVTENNNLKGFSLDQCKSQDMTNEDEFLNSPSANSYPRSLHVVDWRSAVRSSTSNLEITLCGPPHVVWGGSRETQLVNGLSKSEASTYSLVSLDWYKPLTTPVRSASLTEEVSKSDMTHSGYQSDSQAVSCYQSSRLVRNSSPETCSTWNTKPARYEMSNESQYSLADEDLMPGSRGGKNGEECNEEEEVTTTKSEHDYIESPVSPVFNMEYRTSPFEPLLDEWDGTTNCRDVDAPSDVYSEKSLQSRKVVCGFKGRVKRPSVCSSVSSGDALMSPTLGHELKFNLVLNTNQEKEAKLEEGSTERSESLLPPIEVQHEEDVRTDEEVNSSDDRCECSWAEDDCRGDLDKRTRDENDSPFDRSTSRGTVDDPDVSPRINVDNHCRTTDTESHTNQLAAPEISDTECRATGHHSTLDHTPEPSSRCDVPLTSSQESPVKPLCGFSYLYNHKTATFDSPTEVPSTTCRPVLLRVRPPKANSMVGQLVKMFENRLKFRQRPDVT